MINFGNIEASLRSEIADGNGEDGCELTNVGLLELITRLRQAEKDAARYRWLRDTGCFEGSADDLFHATPAETDAEFDRLMNGSNN